MKRTDYQEIITNLENHLSKVVDERDKIRRMACLFKKKLKSREHAIFLILTSKDDQEFRERMPKIKKLIKD